MKQEIEKPRVDKKEQRAQRKTVLAAFRYGAGVPTEELRQAFAQPTEIYPLTSPQPNFLTKKS